VRHSYRAHPVVEDEVKRADVGVVPARLLDRAADELRAKAVVCRVPARVRPRGQRATARGGSSCT
jgi:hypothetical protein